ncbi:MAG: tRNA pseudouridine(55) synthase TruB [Anaplasmataceae bacterium]|nr:tRNA pseudouridine(55) synthase TruB [Anaplasmataceae bacterium]
MTSPWEITPETEGIFAIWKPSGISSYSAIYRVKKITGKTKVGHAGTLDPLAEGILVVAVGRESTKKLFSSELKEKEYIATIELGAASSTDDAEGEIKTIPHPPRPSQEEIENCLQQFIGKTMQRPPVWSALKINGTRAYQKARRGETFEMKERPAEIFSIELIRYGWPEVEIKVVTGPGVYVRSLARDIGEKLKTGGYLKKLIRTRVGSYTKKEALRLP